VWRPYRNTYSYTNLTNTVWVEYPLGTGFNQGKATATNEVDAAQEFLGFWRTFMDTYGLHGRKVYIAGESYAGYYVPYIASAMYADGNKDYFDLQATQINDPSTSYNAVQQQSMSRVAFKIK
jgi:carboxypeptidase D